MTPSTTDKGQATFGRYAETPYDQMTPEQQEGFRILAKAEGGELQGPAKIWVDNTNLARAVAPLAGCSCATTTTTSSARSGSAGPCPTTTKPAQSTASQPRGCALAPERLIQPDPAIPTNRLGDIS